MDDNETEPEVPQPPDDAAYSMDGEIVAGCPDCPFILPFALTVAAYRGDLTLGGESFSSIKPDAVALMTWIAARLKARVGNGSGSVSCRLRGPGPTPTGQTAPT